MTLQQTMSMMQDRTGQDGGEDGGLSPAESYSTTVFGYRYSEGQPVPPRQLSGEAGTRPRT